MTHRSRGPARPVARAWPVRRHIAPIPVDALLGRQPWEQLCEPLTRAGTDPEPALERLRAFARLLLDWNRNVSNIMSRNDEQRFVERHLLESLGPAWLLRECGVRRWLDFGSGAGLPAIPLAIAGIGAAWTLVESRRTKTLFLRKAIHGLDLKGVEVIHERLEKLAANRELAGRFDGFTSRATLPLAPTLALAASLIEAPGTAVLWKGSGAEREMEESPAWQTDWDLTRLAEIGTGPNRIAVFVRKKER